MNYKLLLKLQKINKEFFTIADLQKILKQEKESLYVTLNRYVKEGWLLRLKSGIYQLAASSSNLEKIANQIYYPSYLSFVSALSQYGIVSQIPYTLTFATTKRSKRLEIGNTEVVFRQLKKPLFFGYKLSGGIYLAEKEKALLDQLYLASFGKSTLNLNELDLKEISTNKLMQYSKKYPKNIQKLLKEIV